MTKAEREYEWAKMAYAKAEARLRRATGALLHGKPGVDEFGPPTAKDQALAQLQAWREFDEFCEENRITITGTG